MTKERKQEIINTYKREENDTGSPEVQVALLTERINELTEHLKIHKNKAGDELSSLVFLFLHRKRSWKSILIFASTPSGSKNNQFIYTDCNYADE